MKPRGKLVLIGARQGKAWTTMREAKVIVVLLDPSKNEVAMPVASWGAADKLARRVSYGWNLYDNWKFVRMYRVAKQKELG